MTTLPADKIKRIVVRPPSWVGDVVMSVPALRHLRHIFPDAHMTIIARTGSADLFREADFVDDVLIQDYSGWRSTPHQIRSWRKGEFDLAVLLQNALHSAAVAFLARVPLRIGYQTHRRSLLLTHRIPVPSWKNDRHEVYYYLNLVREIERLATGGQPAEFAEPSVTLQVSDARKREALEILQRHGVRSGLPLVLLSPGSINSRAKRWPAEYYAALADLFSEVGSQVVLIGSPSDLEVSQRVADGARHKPIILTGGTTVAEVTSIISAADILISNDTGSAHIGAAVGTPTLVIFGPTNPATTRPFAATAEIIRQPPDCAPCMLRDCPIDHRCMTTIQAHDVFARARRLLSHQRAEVIA